MEKDAIWNWNSVLWLNEITSKTVMLYCKAVLHAQSGPIRVDYR